VFEDGRVAGVRGRDLGAGATVTERAPIVIGADGLSSIVARGVNAPKYNDRGALTCAYYGYWSGVEVEDAELYARPGNMIVTAPTNDGQVVVVVLWPNGEFHRVRSDIEGHFLAALELAPGLAERVRYGTRTDRFRGRTTSAGATSSRPTASRARSGSPVCNRRHPSASSSSERCWATRSRPIASSARSPGRSRQRSSSRRTTSLGSCRLPTLWASRPVESGHRSGSPGETSDLFC
jgi:hypothetical protein